MVDLIKKEAGALVSTSVEDSKPMSLARQVSATKQRLLSSEAGLVKGQACISGIVVTNQGGVYPGFCNMM